VEKMSKVYVAGMSFSSRVVDRCEWRLGPRTKLIALG